MIIYITAKVGDIMRKMLKLFVPIALISIVFKVFLFPIILRYTNDKF